MTTIFSRREKLYLQFSACILLVSLSFVVQSSAQICTASYQGNAEGRCVLFPECPPLLDILKSPIKTAAEIRLLQKLTCLADNENPTVCCATTDITDGKKYGVASSLTHKIDQQQDNSTSFIYPTHNNADNIKMPDSTTKIESTTVNLVEPSQSTNSVDEPIQTIDRFGGNWKHPNFYLLPALENCSNAVSTDRIIGGKNAPHGAFPWMARIGYENLETHEIEFYCGGTVINNRYILTAAHCTEEIDTSEFEPVLVRLGEHNDAKELDCSEYLPCSRAQDYRIEKVIPHKKYSSEDKSSDIELIRVNRDISFSTPFIRPVCLPFASEYGIEQQLRPDDLDRFVNVKGTVTGWGRTKWNKAEGSKILQEVQLPIVSNEECQRNYSTRVKITDMQLCAGGLRQMDSCGGDSGGPIVVPVRLRNERRRIIAKFFQMGVVSFGPVHCGVGALPGVYSRISKYKKWILDHMEP